MFRAIFTENWILVLTIILMMTIITGGCFLWLKYTTSPYETDADEDTEFTRQLKKNRQAKTETAETAEVEVSPHGFGPYPEVPADYFREPSWLKYSNGVPGHAAGPFETMDRILIKLWNQGHKNITGASYVPGGKVYPHYTNTAYVSYGEKIVLPDGTVHQSISVVSSGPDIIPFTKQISEGNTPAHIKLIDYDSAGIDPHIFLKEEN